MDSGEREVIDSPSAIQLSHFARTHLRFMRVGVPTFYVRMALNAIPAGPSVSPFPCADVSLTQANSQIPKPTVEAGCHPIHSARKLWWLSLPFNSPSIHACDVRLVVNCSKSPSRGSLRHILYNWATVGVQDFLENDCTVCDGDCTSERHGRTRDRCGTFRCAVGGTTLDHEERHHPYQRATLVASIYSYSQMFTSGLYGGRTG